jgi:hypothetical protein
MELLLSNLFDGADLCPYVGIVSVSSHGPKRIDQYLSSDDGNGASFCKLFHLTKNEMKSSVFSECQAILSEEPHLHLHCRRMEASNQYESEVESLVTVFHFDPEGGDDAFL